MPLTQPLPAGFPWLVPTFPQGAQVVPDRLLHVGHGVVLRCVDTRAGPHHKTQDGREAEFRYEVAGQEALEERRSQQGAILRGQRGVRLRDGTGRQSRPAPTLLTCPTPACTSSSTRRCRLSSCPFRKARSFSLGSGS